VGDTANLSRRTKAPNERRQPDLKVLDFAKGILPLWTLRKLVCSIPQISKHCDNLLHLAYLKYFNGARSAHNEYDDRRVTGTAFRGCLIHATAPSLTWKSPPFP
jgi:hypothetical protein